MPLRGSRRVLWGQEGCLWIAYGFRWSIRKGSLGWEVEGSRRTRGATCGLNSPAGQSVRGASEISHVQWSSDPMISAQLLEGMPV